MRAFRPPGAAARLSLEGVPWSISRSRSPVNTLTRRLERALSDGLAELGTRRGIGIEIGDVQRRAGRARLGPASIVSWVSRWVADRRGGTIGFVARRSRRTAPSHDRCPSFSRSIALLSLRRRCNRHHRLGRAPEPVRRACVSVTFTLTDGVALTITRTTDDDLEEVSSAGRELLGHPSLYVLLDDVADDLRRGLEEVEQYEQRSEQLLHVGGQADLEP